MMLQRDKRSGTQTNNLDLGTHGYMVVDEDARRFVIEMNNLGFKTVSSCAGHEDDEKYNHPYVEIDFMSEREIKNFMMAYINQGAGAWFMKGRLSGNKNSLLISLSLDDPRKSCAMRYKFFQAIIQALKDIKALRDGE